MTSNVTYRSQYFDYGGLCCFIEHHIHIVRHVLSLSLSTTSGTLRFIICIYTGWWLCINGSIVITLEGHQSCAASRHRTPGHRNMNCRSSIWRLVIGRFRTRDPLPGTVYPSHYSHWLIPANLNDTWRRIFSLVCLRHNLFVMSCWSLRCNRRSWRTVM
jgi:hypothetical protein